MSAEMEAKCVTDVILGRDFEKERNPERMTFHVCAGSYIALSNRANTAMKIYKDKEAHSWAMSSRRLLSNEWFSVILQAQLSNPPSVYSSSQYIWIGVTTKTPEEMKEHQTPVYLECERWLIRIGSTSFGVFKDSSELVCSYEYYPFSKEAGFKYSVARMSNGDLHFSVNGQDLGVAAKDVPENVYGYVFLSRYDEKLLISPSFTA